MSESESILQEAQRLIHGERNKNYGHPRENFKDIAALFSGYLGQEISDIDVANLMILVKVARVKGAGYHRDSFTDIAGYAGCVERIYEEPVDTVFDPNTVGVRLDVDTLLGEPRKFDYLNEEIPSDVNVVQDVDGDIWRRWVHQDSKDTWHCEEPSKGIGDALPYRWGEPPYFTEVING